MSVALGIGVINAACCKEYISSQVHTLLLLYIGFCSTWPWFHLGPVRDAEEVVFLCDPDIIIIYPHKLLKYPLTLRYIFLSEAWVPAIICAGWRTLPARKGNCRMASGFHRTGRHCLHQARSAARCRVSRTKDGLHPTCLLYTSPSPRD